VESENDIMTQIFDLAKTKTVLLISHRLANVVGADCIYVMENGNVTEQGTHSELLAQNGLYSKLWNTQQALENDGKGDAQ
jgi:ABC-type multidrug transport system fused ATPase/permease subunit